MKWMLKSFRYMQAELLYVFPVIVFLCGLILGWGSHEHVFGHKSPNVLHKDTHVPLVKMHRQLQLEHEECLECHGKQGDPHVIGEKP